MDKRLGGLAKTPRVMPDPAVGGVKAFVVKRLLSLAMILGIAFLLIVSLVLTAVLKFFSSYLNSLLPAGDDGWVALAVTVG